MDREMMRGYSSGSARTITPLAFIYPPILFHLPLQSTFFFFFFGLVLISPARESFEIEKKMML